LKVKNVGSRKPVKCQKINLHYYTVLWSFQVRKVQAVQQLVEKAYANVSNLNGSKAQCQRTVSPPDNNLPIKH